MALKWGEREINALRQLLKSGYSHSMAAVELTKQFGKHYTSNAVIGKCFRIGIKVSSNSAVKRIMAPKKPRQRAYPRERQFTASPRVMVRATPIAGKPKNYEEKSEDSLQPKIMNILDLRMDSCRFPDGTPGNNGFGYCGRQATHGPYCSHHAKIAYAFIPRNWRYLTTT